VTIATAASAPTGTSTLTVTGTGGSLTHTASVTLTATSATTGSAIVNGDFEAGPLSGWTVVATASAKHSGATEPSPAPPGRPTGTARLPRRSSRRAGAGR